MREIEDQARFYAHTGVVSGRFSVTQAPMVSVNVCRPLRLLGLAGREVLLCDPVGLNVEVPRSRCDARRVPAGSRR